MSNSSPCVECPFKQTIPGDCHVACGHPVANGEHQLTILSLVFSGQASLLQEAFGLTISQHAINNGWADFPMNFDPIWVTGTCSMLESYKKALALHQEKQVAELIHKEV